MKLFQIICLTSCVLICSGLYDPVTRMTMPHVETYWESWDQTYGNYGSNLSNLPVVPIGYSGGFNVVNLAFARDTATIDEVIACEISPDCVTPGLSDMKDNEAFRQAIKDIHDAGGYVKMSFGGVTYGTPGETLDEAGLDLLVQRIVNLIAEYNLDGVDITLNDCWLSVQTCNHPENVVYIINTLRPLIQNKLISLTYPADYRQYPYYDSVIGPSINNLDYVSMIWADDVYVDYLIQSGVPYNKIVMGQIIAWQNNPTEPMCDYQYDRLIENVKRVKKDQLGGVMTWSINSDTYHRGGHPEDAPGVCSNYQTGKEDGTVLNTISYMLNQD